MPPTSRTPAAAVLALLAASCLVGCRPTADVQPHGSGAGHRQARAEGGRLLAIPQRLPELVSSGSQGSADGQLPDGTSVLSDLPGVTHLEQDLLAQLRDAAAAAARDGVAIDVNSGWRSHDYQAELFATAVGTYGSEEEAARWVARPGTSVHEAGEAVDLGPVVAQDWLVAHGAAFGLCEVYLNEPWHFELRPEASAQGCPPPFADPTDDPRMQP